MDEKVGRVYMISISEPISGMEAHICILLQRIGYIYICFIRKQAWEEDAKMSQWGAQVAQGRNRELHGSENIKV